MPLCAETIVYHDISCVTFYKLVYEFPSMYSHVFALFYFAFLSSFLLLLYLSKQLECTPSTVFASRTPTLPIPCTLIVVHAVAGLPRLVNADRILLLDYPN